MERGSETNKCMLYTLLGLTDKTRDAWLYLNFRETTHFLYTTYAMFGTYLYQKMSCSSAIQIKLNILCDYFYLLELEPLIIAL